jgi:hypothetical protein
MKSDSHSNSNQRRATSAPQLMLAAGLLVGIAIAGSASASVKLVSGVSNETSTSSGSTGVDPFNIGSANNPGKISQGPGGGGPPDDGGGDDHKRNGIPGFPQLIGGEDAIGTGPFMPSQPDFIVGAIGRYNTGASAEHYVTAGAPSTIFAPVPAPGALVLLAAAGAMGRRRRL